jgi:hypothetical protein
MCKTTFWKTFNKTMLWSPVAIMGSDSESLRKEKNIGYSNRRMLKVKLPLLYSGFFIN